MKEIEIRALINNREKLENKIIELGYTHIKTFTQHDIILDKPNAELFNSGKKIRIRTENNTTEFTYKGDLTENENISKRTELNIQIKNEEKDNYIKMLHELGYPILFQIKKERTVYKKDNLQITLDEWPIIGCMIEIEGEEEEILNEAKLISSDTKFGNYRLKDFFKQKITEENKTLEQLKKEYIQKTSFDLGNIDLILK